MCFPVNFTKFLRTHYFIEHLRWLLLNIFYKDKIKILNTWNELSLKNLEFTITQRYVFVTDVLFFIFIFLFCFQGNKKHWETAVRTFWKIVIGWKFLNYERKSLWCSQYLVKFQGIDMQHSRVFCCK